MKFLEIVKLRHSVRAFKSDPVEAEKMTAILEAANAAPSAGNQQAYEIYRVRDTEHRAELAQACYSQPYVAQAPEVLVFCAHSLRSAQKYGTRGEQLYALQDATIACTWAMTAAVALGLGSVWVGAFKDHAVWQVIGEPAGIEPIAVLPIGYPAEAPNTTTRRPLAELVHDI